MTVSCLPQFAQPYRLVCNQTIEVFFDGEKDRGDVERWQELLARYRRRYESFLTELHAACGALFGRSPPQEQGTQLLGPGNGSLWRPSRRHRQVGS